ncbi:MAG: TldD/PmbA family protein [Candidatus Sabulitectum sp.]|nr:TldD/PmbA family protein [Candidatus Sabulitectum sp.]
MEKLLELAAAKGCRAEVFSTREKSLSMSKVNGSVDDVSASIQSGVSLRILRDGRLGFAYTKNLIDREELVANALASLDAGVEALYDFPDTGSIVFSEDFDESVEEMSFPDMRERIDHIESLYGEMKQGIMEAAAGCGTIEIRIINTSGADLFQKESSVYSIGTMIYPGTSSGLKNVFAGKLDAEVFEPDVKRTVSNFDNSLPEVEIGDSRMKVLFLPDSMYALTWRLGAASSAKAFYEKVSPLLNKKDKQVFSPLLSVVSNPAKRSMGRRKFDDEGVRTGRVPVFENGVFKNSYNNLDYASKMKTAPLGTGFRSGMWGGDKVALSPSPSFSFANFVTGDKSFEEILEMMDRGVIVCGALGAHSGNILNGDLSIGLNPGLYVENGKVAGRVKDAMMAGNIYEMLSKTIAVENSPHYTGSMYENPSILLDDISVVGS